MVSTMNFSVLRKEGQRDACGKESNLCPTKLICDPELALPNKIINKNIHASTCTQDELFLTGSHASSEGFRGITMILP